MHRFALEPADDDRYDIPPALVEDEREQRWGDFVGVLLQYAEMYGRHGKFRWAPVLEQIAQAHDGYYNSHLHRDTRDFADDEGWPAVYAALSRAVKESGE